MGGIIIENVLITKLNVFANLNGDVLHGMKNSDIGYEGFGEVYFSTILKEKVKAWKKHKQMVLNFVCPVGSVNIVLIDDRQDSPTYKLIQEIQLSRLKNYSRLTIPPNIWVGFQGLDEINIIMNIASITHDPSEYVNISIDEFFYKHKW